MTFQFILCQAVSVFFICLNNLHAASHTCGICPITSKCVFCQKKNIFFFSYTYDFSFSNNAASAITCLIVIDTSDFVKLSIGSRATCLRSDFLHVGKNPQNSTHCCSCFVSKQAEVKPNSHHWGQQQNTNSVGLMRRLENTLPGLCKMYAVFTFIRTMGLFKAWTV